MLDHHRPHVRAALLCALIVLVAVVTPAAALATAGANDRATRAALATERYWSTYDVDTALPSPPRSAPPATSDGGAGWTTTIALVAVAALCACAAGVYAGRVTARPRGGQA
jgi:hypothetical protein